MKIKIPTKSTGNESGSTFLLAMLLVIIVVPLAVSYMLAAQQQYRLVDRSQTWNTALPVAEGGIEEAFAHLNRDCYSNIVNLGTLGWGNDGWTSTNWNYTNSSGYQGTAYGYKSSQRWLGTNYYIVTIATNATTDTSISPTDVEIASVGYSPSRFRAKSIDWRLGTTNLDYGARQVRVRSKVYFYNSAPINSLDDTISKGRGITVDAFDPSKSWGGLLTTNILPNGDMVSINGSISFSGGGTVNGTASTSAHGAVDLGANTTITGGTNNTINSEMPDPQFDKNAASLWTPLSACVSGCTYTYTNVTSHPVPITTDVYPSAVTTTITTNYAGKVTTSIWPSNYTAGPIATSIVATTTSIYPVPVPSGIIGSIYTNAAPQWFTNLASGSSDAPVAPPTYPTNFAASTGVIVDSTIVSNFLASAPANDCCVYTNFPTGNSGYWDYVYKQVNGTNTPDKKALGGGNFALEYQYRWIKDYRYQIAGSFTYTNYVYSYTNLTYTYMGTNESTQVITDNYKYIAKPSGNYYVAGDLTLSGDNMLVEGNVTIYVAGNVSISGNSTIIIPDGSSLTFYFGGNVSMKGNGGIDNESQRAQNLTMWGLPTCTSIDIGGNAAFVGTLYAPEADVSLKGSGNSDYDIVGAISGKTVTIDGKFRIDYPLDLRINGPNMGFVASKWIEEVVGVGP